MKIKAIGIIIFIVVMFCLGLSNAQDMIGDLNDINNDGTPDVMFHKEGVYMSRVEADTNFDKKSDVTVDLENGKFKSAEVDTDYNGTPDKKFSDVAEFNKWLNDNHPDFKERLGFSDDGTFTAAQF